MNCFLDYLLPPQERYLLKKTSIPQTVNRISISWQARVTSESDSLLVLTSEPLSAGKYPSYSSGIHVSANYRRVSWGLDGDLGDLGIEVIQE